MPEVEGMIEKCELGRPLFRGDIGVKTEPAEMKGSSLDTAHVAFGRRGFLFLSN